MYNPYSSSIQSYANLIKSNVAYTIRIHGFISIIQFKIIFQLTVHYKEKAQYDQSLPTYFSIQMSIALGKLAISFSRYICNQLHDLFYLLF